MQTPRHVRSDRRTSPFVVRVARSASDAQPFPTNRAIDNVEGRSASRRSRQHPGSPERSLWRNVHTDFACVSNPTTDRPDETTHVATDLATGRCHHRPHHWRISRLNCGNRSITAFDHRLDTSVASRIDHAQCGRTARHPPFAVGVETALTESNTESDEFIDTVAGGLSLSTGRGKR